MFGSRERVERQLHDYVLLVATPVWIAAGLLDWVWHRKTNIESTTRPKDSALHLAMPMEAAPVALAPLLFEVNAGAVLPAANLERIKEMARHPGQAKFGLRLKENRPSPRALAGVVAAITIFDFAPHVEEFPRCWRARRKRMTGRDTPACPRALCGGAETGGFRA